MNGQGDSRFACAVAFAEDWAGAVERCISALEPPTGANLGFVYLSDRLALHAERIVERLRQATGVRHWTGCVGVGVCGGEAAALDRGGLSVLLCRFPDEAFRVFSGRQPLQSSGLAEPYFAVVHADPNTADMGELVRDMAGKLSSGFLTGGLSSSRGRSLQIADGVLAGGISGVAFGPQVAVATRLTQGCRPLPGRHVISEADGHVISRLDRRPALEVYREAIGDAAKDLDRAVRAYLVGLPVAGRESGDYLVRQVVAVDPRSGLIAINEEVQEGQELLVCERSGEAAEADMRRMLGELRASLPSAPGGGLYFSCLGRGGNAFEDDGAELRLIRESLGELPIAGFFCAGEISHDRLYGYTGVLTLFL